MSDVFEEAISLIQDLSFIEAKKEFELREVEFGKNQMRSLMVSDKDGLYTNLGLLISNQCLHTIKVAAFEGLDQSVFKDCKEFCGSIFKQMNEVYDFIDFRNQKHSSINGLYRTDIRDYPEVALRESLMNLLVHRDYSFSASSIINIYEDRIEFISIGGLLTGVELDDVLNSLSICRNPKLANLFYRLELIESYGTGLNKIFNAYEGTNYRPRIIVTKNSFKVILPNLNYDGQDNLYQINDNMFAYTINEEDAVLNYLKKHNKITRLETEHLLNTSSSTAYRLLRKMHENGLLIQCGRAKNIEYKLA